MALKADASVAAVSARQSESGLPSPWLVSRNVDNWFILGGAVVLSFSLFLASQSMAVLGLAGALFAMLTDMPHVMGTTLRIGLDPRERAIHGKRYLISLAVVTLVVFGFFITGNRPIVAMVWIVWQFFHVMKQHYGIVRIYSAKVRYRGSFRLATVMLFLGCGSPFLHRARLGMRFGEYEVFGQRMPFSGLGLPTLPIPQALVTGAYVAFGLATLLFWIEQGRRAQRGERVMPFGAQATLVLAIASYNLAYLFVSDLYALIMIAATMHSLQYHVIMWRRNVGRFAPVDGEAREPGLLSRLSQRKNLLAYAGFGILVGASCANTELIWFGFIPFVLVLHHFYMDGFLWRSNMNPGLGKHLGMSGPARSAGQAKS